MSGRSIRFVYADPPGFSGQRNAARIVWEGMQRRGWACELLPLPAADRTSDRPWVPLWVVGYAVRIAKVWGSAWRLGRTRPTDLTVLACSQTLNGLIRDGIAMLLTAPHRMRCSMISLNGNSFTRWQPGDVRARILRYLVGRAACITVVGEKQRRHLERLGIAAEAIRVVPNTADTPLIREETVVAKHENPSGPIRILYLSSLIASKGYPMLLEAMQILGQGLGPAIELTLCGKIVITQDDRTGSEASARASIESMLAAINESPRVRVQWIEGVVGEAKNAVLARSHIFVLPTRYPVEAQPLALLEAMASGCAIVTTDIAEIPALFPREDEAAILLHDPSAQRLSEAIEELVTDPGRRLALALAARTRFERHFTPARHLDVWESLCVGVCKSR